MQFPVFVEHGEDGYYVVQCPMFEACYTQGKTLDEAFKNIKEVIEMCIEEELEESKDKGARLFAWRELGLHTVTLA